MQIKTFEDLEIWKEARHLTREIYTISKAPHFSKDYGLRGQMQRAAVSIMSNIAEGFERGGNQEFVQFLYIAKGSCGEFRSQLYVALDQSYINQKIADNGVNPIDWTVRRPELEYRSSEFLGSILFLALHRVVFLVQMTSWRMLGQKRLSYLPYNERSRSR
jgi:four helix bundle protein